MINRANFSTEDAIDRHAQRGGLAVHRTAAADHEIGMPEQIQAINGGARNDRARGAKPLRPVLADEFALLGVAREQHDADIFFLAGQFHEAHEKLLALRIVVMRLGRGRAHGDEHLLGANAQRAQELRVAPHPAHVHVLLDAGIFSDALGRRAQRLVRNHLGHHLPRRAHERRVLCELVVRHQQGGNAEQVGNDDLRTCAVRERKIGLLAEREGQQLQGAVEEAEHLHQFVLAVVPSDFRVAHAFLVGEFADLERIARGEHDFKTARAQFVNDRLEEGDVRCVVEVDPDFLALRHGGGGRRSMSICSDGRDGTGCQLPAGQRGDFLRQRGPVLPFVFLLRVIEELCVARDGI